MLEILAKHRGQMSQQLWFDVFRQLYEGYQPHDHLRKLLILLTAARSDSDDSQLSLLIQKLAEVDPEAAEVLLHQLLTARLEFTSHRGILGRPDFLTTEFVGFHVRERSARLHEGRAHTVQDHEWFECLSRAHARASSFVPVEIQVAMPPVQAGNPMP